MDNEKVYCGNCNKEISASETKCPFCGAIFEETVYNEQGVIAKPEVTFDSKVSRTVLGLEKAATILSIVYIVCAAIIFIFGSIGASEAEYDGGGIFLVILIYTGIALLLAYISNLVFNWLSHTLNCLYQLTKKK